MESALLYLEHAFLSLNLGEECSITHIVLTVHLNSQIAIEMSNLQKQCQLNY